MRALAVAAVVAYHLWPSALPAGFLGVDVFMVVSGFIVTRLLLDEHARAGRIRVAAFWGRRFRRLVPALVLVVVAVALFVHVAGPARLAPTVRAQGLSALLYATNWRLVADGVHYGGALSASSPLVHLWSLAVEEQFYLLWPLVLVALLWVGRGRRRVVACGAAALAVVSATEMVLRYDPAHDPMRLYFGTDTRAQTFLVGACFAAVGTSRRRASRDASSRRAWGRARAAAPAVAALGALVAATRFATDGVLYRGGFFAVALVAGWVTRASVHDGAVARLLDRRPLRGLGRVSYGVYLWHWPAVALLTPARVGCDGAVLVALRLAVTAAGTALSWCAIERPFTRARPRRVAWSGALAVGVATVSVVALPAAPFVPYASYRTDHLPPPVVLPARAIAIASHRNASPATAMAAAATTAFTLPRAGTAMLVGDSGMFSAEPALVAGLQRAGWRVVSAAYPGVGLTRPHDALAWWARDVRAFHVDLTIVMLGAWDVSWVAQHGDAPYRALVDHAVAAFAGAGGRVLWVRAVPGGDIYDRSNERFYAAVAVRHPGIVRYVDVAPALRDDHGHFPPIVDGHRLRQLDGWHLCPDGAAAYAHAVLAVVGLDAPGWDAGEWRHDGRYDMQRACPAP